MNRIIKTGIFLSAALSIAVAPRAEATASPDRAAAIVTYPLVRVDPAAGVDTFLQLNNADAAPIDALCFLENYNSHCTIAGSVCTSHADCPSGEFCAPDLQVTSFQIGLTARQPISWQAKDGLAALPLIANTGSIPPVSEIPFTGALRCIAVDAAGTPIESNALTGEATIERYDAAAPAIDAAKYNALGFAALAGANNGDGELVLGGAQAEYEGCPNVQTLQFLTDGAIEPATGLDEVHTQLALTACSSSFFDADLDAGDSVAQYFVYNEFEQSFSTSNVISGQMFQSVALIDTNDPTRSIFAAGVIGTLAGKVDIAAFGSGLIGVAVEEHHRVAAPQSYASAGFNLHVAGERVDPDVLRTAFTPCSVFVRNDCRSAGKSSLSLADRDSDSGDRFLWKLRRGEATSAAEFGQPQSTTDYTICLYSGVDQDLAAQIDIPASAQHWSATANGFRYSDPAATEDGVRRILLKGSSRDSTTILVRGARESLPDFPLSSLSAPVVVQLLNDGSGLCWQSSFPVGHIQESSAERFEARN